MAVAGYLLLPNYPSNTMWLTEEESALATYRISREVNGEADEVKNSVMLGFRMAFTDPKVYLLVFIQTCAVIGMSFTCKSLWCPIQFRTMD
jgi:hypothetical protein